MGEPASTYTLPGLLHEAEDLFEQTTALRSNTRGKFRLQILTQQLIEMLQSADSVSHSAPARLISDLLAVRETVLSVLARQRRPQLRVLWCCSSFYDEYYQLEDAEKKLVCLRTEAVVVGRVLQLVKENTHQHVTDCVTLNRTSSVELKCREHILNFLLESQFQELRVIIIMGKSGVDKTKLLNHVWREASSELPFQRQAYVLTGHCGSSVRVTQLQSSIVWQLGGGNMEFPSSAMGRAKLSKHLELLKMKEMPVFLAIDDVNKAEDLVNLLPSSLGSENFPPFSCIALTCRDSSVMNALLNICHLQADNLSQICHFQPTLEHFYGYLSPSCKAAFLDIVSTFYGWSWETATRVVGALAMQELESHGFICQLENLDNCKQSALREGYDLDQWHYAHNTSGHKVVGMDDSTLQFGESILANDNNWHYQFIEGPFEDHAFLQQRSSLRNLVLFGNFQSELLHPLLQGAANLKVLVLRFYDDKIFLLRASHGEASIYLGRGLRCLMLVEQKTSRLIMEMMVYLLS